MGNWAEALQGFSAGVSGQLPAWRVANTEKQSRLDELEEKRLRAMAMDFNSSLTDLKSGNVGAAWERLLDRHEQIIKLGGDPTHTENLMGMLKSGDVNGAVSKLEQARAAAVQDGLLKAEKENKLQFGPGETFKGPDNKFYFATQKRNPISGEVETVMSEVPEGYQMVGSAGLTASEQINQKGAEARAAAEGRETGGGNVTRLQGFVDAGYDAAKGIPVLKRAETLLGLVETGGIDNAMLKAKKWFGVESANEAELSANLGKAIVSQLRATFGAAFTAKEGDKLESIEANFGKSTEGNKRLIRQTLKIANEYVNIGLKAADKLGDYDTVQAITRLRDFTLDDDLAVGNIIEVDW